MQQVSFERIDWGMSVAVATKKIKGKKKPREVRQLVWRESIVAIVNGKRFEKLSEVPYFKDDTNMPRRRLAAFRIRWRELTEEILDSVFCG